MDYKLFSLCEGGSLIAFVLCCKVFVLNWGIWVLNAFLNEISSLGFEWSFEFAWEKPYYKAQWKKFGKIQFGFEIYKQILSVGPKPKQ